MVMPKNPTGKLPNSLAFTAGYPKPIPTDLTAVPVGDPQPPPDEPAPTPPAPPEPAPEPTDPSNP